MKFVADTHALFWYLENHPKLSDASKRFFDETTESATIVIPTIVVAELIFLLKKSSLDDRIKVILDFLESEPRFELYPLTVPIVRQSTTLKDFEIHDALIVATARHLAVPLMTADQKIIASGMVHTLRP